MKTGRLTAALSVRPEEVGLVVRIFALFAVTQASHGLAANAADALFLLRFGVERLPLMILLSGPAVMAAVLAHGIGLASKGPARWLRTVTLTSVLAAALAWASVGSGQIWVYPVIWISTQMVTWVTFTMMWNSAEAACNTRQAKRLFPLFASGGVIGGVAGNLLTGPLASGLGTQHLLLAQAVLLAGSTFLLTRSRDLFIDDSESGPTSIREDLSATWSTVRSNRLLRLAAITSFLMAFLFFLVVFPFNQAVVASYGSEAEVASFLGIFSSLATATTFLVSLLLTKRLFARLGIVVALMLVPLAYLAGFSLWLVSFNLLTAALARALQWVAVNAIGTTAFAALFNVVTGRRRGQLLAIMTAVPGQIGTMLGGGLLLLGLGLARSLRFGTGLAIATATLAVAVAMRPAYRTAIVTAVRQGLIGVFSVPQRGLVTPIDADTVAVLKDHLDDDSPDIRAMALSAMARVEEGASLEQLERHLSDQNPRVRVAALDSIWAVDRNRLRRRSAALLADPAPEVRLRMLHLGARDNGDARAWATSVLDDPHPRVAAAAAAIVGGKEGRRRVEDLMATGEVEAVAAVLEQMAEARGSLQVDPTPFLDHSQIRVRAAAAAAYPYWSGEASALLPGLDDPSPRVRRASALALAQTPAGRDIIHQVLGSGSVRATDEALSAITPMEVLTPEVTAWAAAEAERVSKLRRLQIALEQPSPPPAGEFLLKVLAGRAARLEHWVLLAITTTRTRELLPVLEGGLRSDNSETRAQAIEALEMTGDRKALAILLPLLESSPPTGPADRRGSLRELANDFDPWLRALATRCLAEEIASDLEQLRDASAEDPSALVRSAVVTLTDMTTERINTLNPMDRVLALHRIPMFAGLDPEDLELIAKATEEVHYSANQPIYREGDEAGEMLVIVEGQAVVTKERGGTAQLIHTYGSGQHVGELALLGGGRRSADVSAGDQGLHGITISKADLQSILEERPAVAMGMLNTLSRRLIEQTQADFQEPPPS